MSIIREENGRLTVCYNNETMWIEPWGENALRVRACKQCQMPTED